MSRDPLELDWGAYRPNVGVVVFDARGRVWLGRRAGWRGPHNWQFPQGGVDPGEDLEDAARRELQEETGIRSVELLARTSDWVAYDFPTDAGGAKAARGYRGQRQIWFAFRFTGDEAEVNLDAHPPAEFDAWRWAELEEAVEMVVPFKREVYRHAAETFAALAGVPAADLPVG